MRRRDPRRPPLAWRRTALGVLVAAGAACREPAPATAPPPVVEVMKPLVRDVPIVREWVGTLDGSVNAEIRPQVDGYVLKQLYREGGFVPAGAVLFEIDARPFRAALDQARAEALAAKARADVERYRPLAADRAISREELDNAIASQREAEAEVAGAKAQVERAALALGWTELRSPIAGVAGIARTQVGDLVNGSTVMTTVSTVDPIKVYFSVSEQDYLHWSRTRGPVDLGPRPETRGMLELLLSDGTVYPFHGDPVMTDRSVDVKTGTLAAAGLFPNPERLLRPGQYAKVRATIDTRRGALVLPERAISELQGAFQVAVVGSDHKVEVRPVRVGARLDGTVVIEEGLAASDDVIVEGLQKARPGAPVDPRPVGGGAGVGAASTEGGGGTSSQSGAAR